MYTEDDLIPLSALQHILFCERQCALIHIEQVWVENLFTAQGRIMHERVDRTGRESRREVRLEYGVPLRSLRLGVIGKADMIEFHRREDGGWRPFPVEYKRGKPKKDNCDRVQLCAQAICLEEMLAADIPEGALFYGQQRRRQAVVFDDELRSVTTDTAIRLHTLIDGGTTPPAIYEKKCDTCSLLEVCLPKIATGRKSVAKYLRSMQKT
jgi:CRISPR-associated exonuclease Cas4